MKSGNNNNKLKTVPNYRSFEVSKSVFGIVESTLCLKLWSENKFHFFANIMCQNWKNNTIHILI